MRAICSGQTSVHCFSRQSQGMQASTNDEGSIWIVRFENVRAAVWTPLSAELTNQVEVDGQVEQDKQSFTIG